MGRRGKRRRSAPSKAASSTTHTDEGVFPLLALPVEVLEEILDELGPRQLLKLLQTSRVAAQLVMKYASGKITRKVQLNHKLGGIKKLLQWAPPACLRLDFSLINPRGRPSHWKDLSGLFGTMVTSDSTSSSSQAQDVPQFPCVHWVVIEDCTLPSLVPEALAATCPNLHTLHLEDCVLEFCQQDSNHKENSIANSGANTGSGGSIKGTVTANAGSSGSKGTVTGNAGSSGSKGTVTGNAAGSVWVAEDLHTLTLSKVSAPQLDKWPESSTHHTQSKQPADTFAEQLRSTASNLHRLCLFNKTPYISLVEIFGPQLRELHVDSLKHLSTMKQYGVYKQLPQLQKLEVPGVKILSAADMELLLSMPHLTHLELDSIDGLTADYSSRTCKWQYLQLRQSAQPLMHVDTLLQLPLHSLTQPLTLGHPSMRWLRVGLPAKTDPETFAKVEGLAQQLAKCGVKLETPLLCWSGHLPHQDEDTPFRPGAQLVPSFTAMATAYGPHTNVQLEFMLVDQAMLQALAAVYKDSLQVLVLRFVTLNADTRHAWPAVLAALPNLNKVELVHCWDGQGELEDLVDLLRCLALAVAQQPDQRCVVVTCFGAPHDDSYDVEEKLMEDAPEQLTGVELVAKEYELCDVGLDHVWNSSEIHIKKKPVS